MNLRKTLLGVMLVSSFGATDGDGVSDRRDRDRDGDGVPNRRDSHPGNPYRS